MAYIIQVLKKKKNWYWRLKNKGRILAHSETYSTKRDCLKTAGNLASELWRCEIEEG